MILLEVVIGDLEFKHPVFLALFLALALAYWGYIRFSGKRLPLFRLSSLSGLNSPTWRTRIRSTLPWIRLLGLSALILALARPRQTLREERIKAEGIDILMVMDLSSSMLAQIKQCRK